MFIDSKLINFAAFKWFQSAKQNHLYIKKGCLTKAES